MTVEKAEKDGKLKGLNHTLTSIENEMLHRRAEKFQGRYFRLLDTVKEYLPPAPGEVFDPEP